MEQVMPKKDRKPDVLRIILTMLIVLLLLVSSFTIVRAAETVPTPGELLPEGSPVDVTILTPDNGDHFNQNKQIIIVVDFVSLAPLERFELYANNEIHRGFDLSGIYNHERKEFNYGAFRGEETVTFTARAWDVEGNMGISSPVTVQITNPLPLVATMPIEPGTTLQEVADQTGMDLHTLSALNYGTDPDNPDPLGSEINIPTDTDTMAGNQIQPLPWPSENEMPEELDMQSTANLSTSIATYLGTLTGNAELPSAPTIAVNKNSCAQVISITDTAENETGFFVYRARGSGDFERIATLKANNSEEPFTATDPMVYGNVTYYVAAFNAAGEAPSAPMNSIMANDLECLKKEWMQPVWTKTDFQITAPVDSFYCYANPFSSTWTRVPLNPRESFPVSEAGDGMPIVMPMPLENYTGGPSGLPYALECWGYSGNTLISLGSGQANPVWEGDRITMSITGANFSFDGELVWTADNLPNSLPPENKLLSYPINLHFSQDPVESDRHGLFGGNGMLIDHYVELLSKGKSILVWDLVGVFPGPGEVIPDGELSYYRIYQYNYDTQSFEHHKWVSHLMSVNYFTIPWKNFLANLLAMLCVRNTK
jgi:LysM repeat protein